MCAGGEERKIGRSEMGLDLHSIEAYHRSLSALSDGCSQAVVHYLDRIEAQRHLNAFLVVYAEEALARARVLDEKRRAGQPLGKLHGVVIALKDGLHGPAHGRFGVIGHRQEPLFQRIQLGLKMAVHIIK